MMERKKKPKKKLPVNQARMERGPKAVTYLEVEVAREGGGCESRARIACSAGCAREGRDAGRGAGCDAGRGAGRDVGRDAGRDAGCDVGCDVGRDVHDRQHGAQLQRHDAEGLDAEGALDAKVALLPKAAKGGRCGQCAHISTSTC
jgi:hypothetical protein